MLCAIPVGKVTGHRFPAPHRLRKPPVDTAPCTSFSTLIRTASHEQHTEAETSTFMSDLLGGKLGVDAYARYTEQLWFVYGHGGRCGFAGGGPGGRALHPARADARRGAGAGPGASAGPGLAGRARPAARHRGVRVPRGGVRAELARRLCGAPLHALPRRPLRRPDHPRQGGEDLGVRRKGDGVRFYVFEGIANPAAFKRTYRELLDAVRGGRPGEAAHRGRVQAGVRAEHGCVPGAGRGVPAVGA